MFKILSVKHDNNGEIIEYKLSSGEVIGKQEAVKLAEKGQIEDVTVGTSKYGEKFLRSIPDADKKNNMDNLPEIE